MTPTPGTERLVLTVTETARTLGCSRATVLNLIRAGRLRALRLGSRAYRIPSVALEELLAASRDGAAYADRP